MLGRRVRAVALLALSLLVSHAPAQTGDVPATLRTAPALSSPQELWQAWGLDLAALENLAGQGGGPPEQMSALLAALGHLARVPLEQAEAWARPLSAGGAGEGRGPEVGDVVALRGRIVRFDELPLVPELRERFETEHAVRAELELPDGGRAIVFANRAPRRWQPGRAIDEPAGCLGLLVAPAGEDRPAVFLADRLASYPAGPLGALGFDVGLFDDVEDRRGLVGDERECFYQLLTAVGRADERALAAQAEQDVSVAPLFNQPDEQRGRLLELEGRARRAVLVKVPDRDIVSRFGIREYWELELVTPDSQRNPLVVCVRELPSGMPSGSDINVPVRVAGFFVKSWAYRGAGEGEAARGARRLAPLLIGLRPELIEHSASTGGAATAIGGSIALGLVGLLLGWAAWRMWRDERRQPHRSEPPEEDGVRRGLRELEQGNSVFESDAE